jgi:hypothetical protein
VVCGVFPSDKLQKGDPYRLVNAIDYNGHVCGSDKVVKHKPYAYYLLDKSVVCVKSCPTTTDYYSYEKYVCKTGYQPTNKVDAAINTVKNYCMYPLKTKPGMETSCFLFFSFLFFFVFRFPFRSLFSIRCFY